MRSIHASYRGLLVALSGQLNMTLQTLITYMLQKETLMKSLNLSFDIVIALFIGNKLASKHKNAFGSKRR
jgi:hypothetical protein